MGQQFMNLTAAMFLVTGTGAAQNQDAMMRWGDPTVEKLVPFLPDASSWGFSPESSRHTYDFKGFANDSPHRYLAVLVHRAWWFNDAELPANWTK